MSHESRPTSFIHQNTLRIAAGAMACVALAGIADPEARPVHHEVVQSTTSDVFIGPPVQNAPLPESDLNMCAPIDPESLQIAENLATEPTNPLLEQVIEKVGSESAAATRAAIKQEQARNPQDPDNKALVDRVTRKYYATHAMQEEDDINVTVDAQVARQTGVTVYDPRSYVAPLEADIENPAGPKLPFDTYFEAAKAYVGKYGIQLTIAGKDTELYDHLAPLVPLTKNNWVAKQDMVTLITEMSHLPQQYVDLTGVKKITLAGDENPEQPKLGAGAYYFDNEITINLSDGLDENRQGPIWHEMGHGLDSETCGGSDATQNDPDFLAYGNGQTYIGQTSTPTYASAQNFYKQADIQALDKKEQTASPADKQNIEQQIDAQRMNVGFISDYSETNIVEDKADELKAITSNNWISAFSESTPFVRNKSTFLLARIVQYNKALGKYFARTASREDLLGSGMQ